MSAAVNRPHDVCSSRPHLPLTGELHPLRREFERLLATGNAVALTFSLLVCTVVYFWPRDAAMPIIAEIVKERGVYPSPPPIDPHNGGTPGLPAITPDIDKANFEPVDDKELTPNLEELERGGTGEPGEEPSDGPLGPVDETPFEPPVPPAPDPDDFVFFDSPPELISIDPPHYPEMVREAGIDGTVHVRVLVGANGRVKALNAIDGSAVLRNAAVASARTAVFKPAMQGTHPVDAWVVIPITFEIRERY